ncbi:aldose epimerase family protein [Neolewinella antarctica]|uniref:Aldose 1-epimerase n=1 Tax=Neolewinella antarctica TaxID=442734 RepID=A0ABX0X945_9BACT|nr:aldose epimerase family protein [Neolewinella antarctica]NJC25785.1 aldose 1-epimerase [Neolewinella antarctica]
MPTIITTDFGEAPGQGMVQQYALTNDLGNTVKITNYGALVTSIVCYGGEMVIGFDSLAGYLEGNPYYGATIGRYGNRIAGAQFSLNEEQFDLVANDNGNQLHGGPKGFDKYVWTASTEETSHYASLRLTHVSPDGDMGFPGELTVHVTYTWDNENALRINYEATSTKDTIVNLTNHTYFNIGTADTVHGLELVVSADRYVPVNEAGIPFGETEPVVGTPFDFTSAKPVGQDIDADHPQIQSANGYDNTWAINDYDGSLRPFAVLSDPASGRKLFCSTTEPGVQVFTTNFGSGDYTERGGRPLTTHRAICLETQHFPDSPNQENFTTPRLKVGETYRTTTVYRFE